MENTLLVPPVSVQLLMRFPLRSFCSDPENSVYYSFTADLWHSVLNLIHEVVVVIVEPLYPVQLRYDRPDDDTDMFLI